MVPPSQAREHSRKVPNDNSRDQRTNMPPANKEERISRRFWFEHDSGVRLYPYRLRNNRTGQIAFRVAPGAAGANTVESQTQLDDEDAVFQHVFGRGWSVRMRSLDGKTEGLYSKTGSSIVRTSETAGVLKRLTATDYRRVLSSLPVSDKAKSFLIAHYHAVDRKASMEELAFVVGYDDFRTANLHYGKLGHRVADELHHPPIKLGAGGYDNWVQSLASADGERNDEGHFLWTQRPEVESALELLGWVRPDQAPVRESGDVEASELEGTTTRDAVIAARRGQGLFRHRVLQYWGGVCSVTGCTATGLLLASHIKPWAKSPDLQRRDGFNGLLLTPNLDQLFDKYLISFGKDGQVMIASSLSAEDRLVLGLTASLRIDRLHERHEPYLSAHRTRFLAINR